MLETPVLLVSSPQMVDPIFGRTVILLWAHEVDGSMGVVINRPMGITVEAVLQQLSIASARPVLEPVLWGGPVMPETGFLICRGNVQPEEEFAFRIRDRIYVSSSRPLLERAAMNDLDCPFYLCLGYAGWGPRQLDEEIERGSWIVVDMDEETVFSIPLEKRWDRCIRSLGVEAEQIWMSHTVDE